MAGDVGGVETLGPAARLWRNVYRKAIEAGAARAAELVRDHVYLFHRTVAIEGGGGGGGGMVELGRTVATAGLAALRVPASGALPTGYSSLWLACTGRAQLTGQRNVYLYFNDDQTTAYYNYGGVAGVPSTGAVAAVGSGTASAIHVGNASGVNALEPQSIYGLSATVPLHAGTVFPKTVQVLAAGLFTAATFPEPKTIMGVYAPSPAGPITSVHLSVVAGGWGVGSLLVVYGCPNPA